jgi:hypothetical protein
LDPVTTTFTVSVGTSVAKVQPLLQFSHFAPNLATGDSVGGADGASVGASVGTLVVGLLVGALVGSFVPAAGLVADSSAAFVQPFSPLLQ